MNQGSAELRHGVSKSLFSSTGNAVSLTKADAGVDVELGIGVEAMSDPPHLHAAHCQDARLRGQRSFRGVNKCRVDTVKKPPEHVAHGGAQHCEDGKGDEYSDDGIGQRKAQCDTASAEKYCQGGESVGAGVEAVGNQGGRADTAADTDAVDSDQFVADEPDETGGSDPADVLDGDRVEEPTN